MVLVLEGSNQIPPTHLPKRERMKQDLPKFNETFRKWVLYNLQGTIFLLHDIKQLDHYLKKGFTIKKNSELEQIKKSEERTDNANSECRDENRSNSKRPGRPRKQPVI